MTVYLLIHQTPGGRSQDGLEYSDTIEIVGAYQDSKKALLSYEFYLDQLEKVWREDAEANASNTFNRFSEPTATILATADVGGQNGKPDHSVWIAVQEVE
jgi:hypothetical protein